MAALPAQTGSIKVNAPQISKKHHNSGAPTIFNCAILLSASLKVAYHL